MTPERRLKAFGPTVGRNALAALGACCLTIGLLAVAIWSNPIHAGDRIDYQAIARSDAKQITMTLAMYAADGDDRVPPFRSDALPIWWKRYARGPELDGNITFTVVRACIGQKFDALKPGQPFIRAAGPGIQKAVGVPEAYFDVAGSFVEGGDMSRR